MNADASTHTSPLRLHLQNPAPQRWSFSVCLETLKRLAANQSKQSAFYSVVKSFAFGAAPCLDFSGGLCHDVSDEEFDVALSMLPGRPDPIVSVDVSGGCSERQIGSVLRLMENHKTIVRVVCRGCSLPKALLWEMAEMCVMNEVHCERAAAVLSRRAQKRMRAEREMAWAAMCNDVTRQETSARCAIGEEQRKVYVRMCAAEHMSLVSAHRATKRHEQEVEFKAMRCSLCESEERQRCLVVVEELQRMTLVTSLHFESLMRKLTLLRETQSRAQIADDALQSKRTILQRQAALLKRHREMMAALSMEEFSSRRDIAVLEANSRSYIQGNGRDMRAEAMKFTSERVLLEDADLRRRRIEWDRLERDRHGFREHVRHEDSRIQLEKSRERERFVMKFNQSCSSLEREEATELRYIREGRLVLLGCSRAVSAASEAEMRLANFCRWECQLQLHVSGRLDVYSFAVVKGAGDTPGGIPWFPLTLMGLSFAAEQPVDAPVKMTALTADVRALRRKAAQLIEESESRLFLDPNQTERALFFAANDVHPPLILDAECCPNVERFLSRRKVVRDATILFELNRNGGSNQHPFTDELQCVGFEGVESSVELMGLSWRALSVGSHAVSVSCSRVTPDDVHSFDEGLHSRLTRSISDILNRLCFRRVLAPSSLGDVASLEDASIVVRITFTCDGVDTRCVDSVTQKLNRVEPLSCRTSCVSCERVIRVKVLDPVLVNTSVSSVQLHACHGFSNVLSSVKPFAPSSSRHLSFMDASATISIVGDVALAQSLSLVLRVDPGTLILDECYETTGGAFLHGKRISISPSPVYFSLSPHGFQFVSESKRISEIHVELDGSLISDDICDFLQQCVVLSPINGGHEHRSSSSSSTPQVAVRIVVMDAHDVASVLDVPIQMESQSQSSSNRILLLSPNAMRPLTLHPGDDPTLLGVPNTIDAFRSVPLLPRLTAFFPQPAHNHAELVPNIATLLVTGCVTATAVAHAQDSSDPDRFIIFSPAQRAQRLQRAAQTTSGGDAEIVVSDGGPSVMLTVNRAPLARLIRELQTISISCTHFLLRPKKVSVQVMFDVTLQDNQPTANNDTGTTWPLQWSIPIEVHEGLAPITVTKKRVSVVESKGWYALGPFKYNKPDPQVFCDAFNGNSLRVWIADGKGPEDLIVLRGVGSIRLRLISVKRKPASGSTSNQPRPQQAAILSPSLIDSAVSPQSNTAATAGGGVVEGQPASPMAAQPASKSALLFTPRRKGPLKPIKVDEVAFDAAVDPLRDEMLSCLSCRFSGRLRSANMDDDVAQALRGGIAGTGRAADFASADPLNPSPEVDAAAESVVSPGVVPIVPPLLPLSSLDLRQAAGEGEAPQTRGSDVLPKFPSDFLWQPLLRAAWIVREHIRSQSTTNRIDADHPLSTTFDEMTTNRSCRMQSNMVATYEVFRTRSSCSPSSPQDSDGEALGRDGEGDGADKFIGLLTQERAALTVSFIPPSPYHQPVFAEDVLAVLRSVAYACDPCTALASSTKLVECAVRAADGPEIRFSQLLAVQKVEGTPLIMFARHRLVLEPNAIEVMSIGALPVAPYAQVLVAAQGLNPYFDGGRLSVEIIEGGQDGDNLYFMNRDEQLKMKAMYELWRQEQLFLRSHGEHVDAMVEEMLHRFAPYEGIAEVSSTGRLNRSNVLTRTKGDEVNFSIGMTENFNPLKIAVDLGPYQPEHVLALHVMAAMNTIGFKTTAGPGERVLRVSLTARAGANAPQTLVKLSIFVNTPQLFIPEGPNGRVFAVKRLLKAPTTIVQLFPAICVSFAKFAPFVKAKKDDTENPPLLRQGFLDIRLVGVESGERLLLCSPSVLNDSDTVAAGLLLSPSTSTSPQIPTAALNQISFYGRRIFVNRVFVGVVAMANATHIKVDFEWSSQCTAEHVTTILKHVHMCIGKGVPVGVSALRRVEAVLCTGTGRSGGTGSQGCTSIITSLVTLDAPVAVEGGGGEEPP